MLTVIVPAVVEPEVDQTIRSLLAQTIRPDRIVIAINNAGEDTSTRESAESVASDIVQIIDLGTVTGKKAGALNAVLAQILPTMGDEDFILVQDADSALDQTFIANALRRMECDEDLGAVGGVFRGQEGGGFVGHLQRNEYARYARDVSRLKGKCLVVTGTAAVFRVRTLRHISRARLEGLLPAGNGQGGIYDTTVLTEDNEISFALMHLGYKILSPADCTLTTEIMPTWRDLWKQRLRWKRGAVENCVQYGFTRVTGPYWGRQLVTMLGVIVTAVYIGTLIWSLIVFGAITIAPFWLGVTAIFALERVVTLRGRGIWRRWITVTLYELPFDLFLQACHGKAYIDAALGRERKW